MSRQHGRSSEVKSYERRRSKKIQTFNRIMEIQERASSSSTLIIKGEPEPSSSNIDRKAAAMPKGGYATSRSWLQVPRPYLRYSTLGVLRVPTRATHCYGKELAVLNNSFFSLHPTLTSCRSFHSFHSFLSYPSELLSIISEEAILDDTGTTIGSRPTWTVEQSLKSKNRG